MVEVAISAAINFIKGGVFLQALRRLSQEPAGDTLLCKHLLVMTENSRQLGTPERIYRHQTCTPSRDCVSQPHTWITHLSNNSTAAAMWAANNCLLFFLNLAPVLLYAAIQLTCILKGEAVPLGCHYKNAKPSWATSSAVNDFYM